MPQRYVIKVAGAAGQGIKTSGQILAKSLKEAGLYSFAYTEYPSLIRGGHNVFQIEISDKKFSSISRQLDVLLALNEESVRLHKEELQSGAVLLYDEGSFTINEAERQAFTQRQVQIIAVNLLDLARQNGGSTIMKNIVSLGAIWKVFGLDLAILTRVISEIFQKNPDTIPVNVKCAEAGYNTAVNNPEKSLTKLFTPDPSFADYLIISGNEAVGLGAIAAGVRLYSSYPMTPVSSLLTYLAKEGTKYGMVVKQAEDEITAANMVIGAYFAGTRAMCATSGGGFDLMTEAVSLAGMTETPFVAMIGQRPGPATGQPTWTAQGDLNLALYSGHGEFPRIVLGLGDVEEAFYLTAEAHNLAERYQTPVLILTDKFLGESYFSAPHFAMDKVKVDRGLMVSTKDIPAGQTVIADPKNQLRYHLTDSGISPRWLPGDKIATFLANSDEHTEKGYTTENGKESTVMYEKRMRKEQTIKNNLPDPEIFGDSTAQIGIISWGSNKASIIDAITDLQAQKIAVAYLHITYLWPLKEDILLNFINSRKITAIIELNQRGQLSALISQTTGIKNLKKFNKYDGRPFYIEELIHYITTLNNKINAAK